MNNSKKFKKLLKYAVLFILSCILIYYSSILNVSAAGYSSWYDNIIDANLPVTFRMFSIASGGNASEITVNNGQSTFNLSVDSGTNDYLTMNYYYNSTPINYGAGNGIGFLFPVDIFLKRGSYYSLTLYFATTNKLTSFSPFKNNRCELTTNNVNYNNGSCYYQLHYKQYKFIVTHNSPDVPFKHQYSLTYMFSSKSANDTFIFLPLTSSVATSNQFYILGYEISFVGEDQTAVMSEIEKLKEEEIKTNQKLDDLNDNINDTDVNGADGQAGGFFNDFNSNDFGLSDIITLPLTTIQSITSKSCTPLSLTLPFVDKIFELPCMTTIYSKFEPFYTIYQTITFGLISYWVCVQIYAMVKNFKDPSKDEIEVMDL